MKTYFVYIITNKPQGTLYIGVTNNLERRILEHKQKIIKGFAARYNLDRWVYFEDFADVTEAVACEKRLKGWTRNRKVELIEVRNAAWEDLSVKWF